jgi:LPPG:FO 2-phospho-L-lactate transferase
LEYRGVESATPAPGVLTALRTAGVVIIAPSSPLASIGPILALPGVIPTLRDREGPTIAVTPVVSAQAPAASPETIRACVRAALMNSHGLDHRAADVAKLYASFAQGFVLDERDGLEAPEIERLGMQVLLADTLAKPSDRAGVAGSVVQFAAELGASWQAT